MSNTIARRQEREAFVKEHATRIGQLLVDDQHTLLGDADGIYAFVTQVVRPALKYSLTTNWMSIWFTIRKDYNRLFNTDF